MDVMSSGWAGWAGNLGMEGGYGEFWKRTGGSEILSFFFTLDIVTSLRMSGKKEIGR